MQDVKGRNAAPFRYVCKTTVPLAGIAHPVFRDDKPEP